MAETPSLQPDMRTTHNNVSLPTHAMADRASRAGAEFAANKMDRARLRIVEFLSVSAAAAIVYHQVMGRTLQPSGVAQSNAVLQAVARALAEVAPIFVLDPDSGTQRPLDEVELAFGVFQRGATLLRTPKAEHRKLAVRRADMRAAIEAFRVVGRRF